METDIPSTTSYLRVTIGRSSNIQRMESSMRFNSAQIVASILLVLALAFVPPASAAMGRTTGSWGVAPSGAATYSIPIWVQPGPKGLQPSLAFAYNSQAG